MNPKHHSMPGTSTCPVRPYTTKELANLYHISVRIFLKWIKPFKKNIGEKNGWFWNVLQVERIFSFLGSPYIE